MIKTLFKRYPPELYGEEYRINNYVVSKAIELTKKLSPGRLEYLISKLIASDDVVGGIQKLTVDEVIEKLPTCNYLTLCEESIFAPFAKVKSCYKPVPKNFIPYEKWPRPFIDRERYEEEFTTLDILCFSDAMSIYDFDDNETVIVVGNPRGDENQPFCVARENILKNVTISSGLSLVVKSVVGAWAYPFSIIDKIYVRPCRIETFPYFEYRFRIDEEKITIAEAKELGFRCVYIIK